MLFSGDVSTRQSFYDRKKEFHSKVKDQILAELNEACNSIKNWDTTWIYDDGYFVADSEYLCSTFLVGCEFEVYNHNMFSYRIGDRPVFDERIDSVQDVVEIIKDLFYSTYEEGV